MGNVVLAHNVCFSDNRSEVTWSGKVVPDKVVFSSYLSNKVWKRLADEIANAQFEEDLRDVATTGMAVQTLERILNDVIPYQPWEIGEALAECLLADELGILWPWNTARDKRT